MGDKSNEILIVGYHGTISCNIESINKYGFDPAKTDKKDNHWLGNGVYFFEKELLARWWASYAEKNSSEDVSGVVYTVKIKTDTSKYSDLDSLEKLAEFWDFMNTLLADMQKFGTYRLNLNKLKSIRMIRGLFFDTYKREYGYDVLKKTFTKKNASYAGFNITPNNAKTIGKFAAALNLYILETQYCVSNKDCIEIFSMDYNINNEGDEYI